ncbi:hypothetical protein P879_01656 [Paragonimus westermani]|uniref:Transcriptional repressor NF-X1 n=1 Tax=Paragonimus westermani TaxID=34504 RepID=A0A8T0DWM6_9TREM|nr:hypothetical protein P879_01656 [Paragonimus westermani]
MHPFNERGYPNPYPRRFGPDGYRGRPGIRLQPNLSFYCPPFLHTPRNIVDAGRMSFYVPNQSFPIYPNTNPDYHLSPFENWGIPGPRPSSTFYSPYGRPGIRPYRQTMDYVRYPTYYTDPSGSQGRPNTTVNQTQHNKWRRQRNHTQEAAPPTTTTRSSSEQKAQTGSPKMEINSRERCSILSAEVQSDLNSTIMGTSSYLSTDAVDSNLRDKLINQLRRGTYQCVVCISKVHQQDPIWSCTTCFHIYHLSCIQSWAEKCQSGATTDANDPATSSSAWRCPACQTKQQLPKVGSKNGVLEYTCFCGRIRNPKYHPARTSIPHGCDEVCGKLRKRNDFTEGSETVYGKQSECTHPCTDLCHPGPCPPCTATVRMTCPCTQVQRTLMCGDSPPGPCGHLCDRKLGDEQHSGAAGCSAGIHTCLFACHSDPCPPCAWMLEIACYCGREQTEVTCGSEMARKVNFTPDMIEILQVALLEFRESVADRTMDTACSDDSFQHLTEKLDSLAISTPSAEAAQKTALVESQEAPITLNQLFKPPSVKLGSSFSCSRVCGKQLTCEKHSCPEPCHPGDCKPCALDPSRCFTCPCCKVPLSKLVSSGDPSGDRTSCTDAVPSCPNTCGRPHPLCGHLCPQLCHAGACPPCNLSITAKCRCGRTSKELTCVRFEELANSDGIPQMLCERVCRKRKVCGRHKCTNKCCELTVHPCSEVCGRRLTCQRHNCEEPCHPGPCGTCWRGVIYTELYCRCGFTVLHPPQPCGSAAPECTQPCSLPHDCDHPVRHTCHNEPACPPCTVLMTKECPGGHGVQFSMPCFQPVLSCGHVCGKPLPGCSHLCQRICHVGDCLECVPGNDGNLAPSVCTQPCQKPRPDCGHPCKLPCHEVKGLSCIQAAASCVKSPTERKLGSHAANALPPCQYRVDLVCSCLNRKERQPCHVVQLKKCSLTLQGDSSDRIVAISPLAKSEKAIREPLKLLACDESCAKAAESVQSADSCYADTVDWKRGFGKDSGEPARAVGADGKLAFEPPEYSEFLRQYALNNIAFATSVERQLFSMVQQFWKPPDKPETAPVRVVNHHFPPMNKKRRRFIRELVEFYGMEAYTFDPEPGRHVMVLAKRGEVRLPGGATDFRGSLTSCLQREFRGTVHIREGIPVPKKPEKKHGLPPASTVRSSYAHILKHGCSQ